MTLMNKMREGLNSLDQRAGLDYLMIRITVLVLTGIGVVMVLTSSTTWALLNQDPIWSDAIHQIVLVIVGLLLFWLMLVVPPPRLRDFAWVFLIAALVLLVLVLIPGVGTGREEVGSQSWLVLGPLRLQPSEAAKIAVAVFGAHLLSARRPRDARGGNPFIVFSVLGLLMTVLIMVEGDLGMAVSFALTVGFVLFFAGANRKWLFGLLGGGLAVMIWAFASGGFRSHRFHVYFDALFGRFSDTKGNAFQSYQGFLSLADGSVAGVGLGQSRAKWFYLPEAKNDFVFAILGEEMGLIGGIIVIMLFGVLGFFGLRTALHAADRYQAVLAATLAASVVAQAFINIGYVIGLLPVTGIQLPMISAGGTSAIINLVAMGILANVARHEPEAVSAAQSYGRPVFDRLLFIPEPHAPRQVTPREFRPRGRDHQIGRPLTARDSVAATGPAPQRERSATRYSTQKRRQRG